jgi:hypothetical protein
MSNEWRKFRLTYEGGTFFKNEYLKKFTSRETDTDFENRKDITHVPAHAKAAIIDIRNSIFQRMVDITRAGGPASYIDAVKGLGLGVDCRGTSMNSYIGQIVLPELLVIGRVGVFVDKPVLETQTLADGSPSPYLYHYQAEDILSWHYDHRNMLDAVLLRDNDYVYDEATGLTVGRSESFRLLRKVPEGVEVKIFYHPESEVAMPKKLVLKQPPVLLELDEIPFHLLNLSHSLMVDIADYQVSLLNMGSSDVNYALKSNFPFYTEQYHPSAELPHLRPSDPEGTGIASDAESSGARKINVGVTQGRRYPIGLDRPGFINPSAEPLRVSMEKQKDLRKEIRLLVNLSVANLDTTRASAESKEKDNTGLEAGLSAIGLELEQAERAIGRIWAQYEGHKGEVTVNYPNNYNLRTDDDRRKEAKELRDTLPTVPSITFQKAIAKQIVVVLVGDKVSDEDLKKMHDEIDASAVVVTDPEIIGQDHERGFVGDELASRLRGYPEGEAEQAAKDHAARAARIVQAQTSMAARGAPDLDTDTSSGKQERKEATDTTMQTTAADRTRGKGQ